MLDNQTIVRAPDGRLISIGRTGVKVETPVKASTGISRSPEINASKPRSSPAQVGAKIDPMQLGARIDPAQHGAKIDPTLFGARIDPTQHGAKIDPTQCGAKIDPSQHGAKIDPAA